MKRWVWSLVLGIGLLGWGCGSGNARRGERVFYERGCPACHTIGQGPKVGPDLQDVGRRYDPETLTLWLADPEAVYRRFGRRPLNPGYPPMPRIAMTPQEVRDLADFLRHR